MKKILLIACSLLPCVLSACNVDCVNPGIGITFIGFDSTALSVVIVKQYAKNSNYTQLIDSSIYSDSEKYSHSFYHTDTLSVSTVGIGSDYDYEVIIPALNKTHRISNISYGKGHEVFFGIQEHITCYVKTHYFYDGRDTSIPAPAPSNDHGGGGSSAALIPISP